MFLQETSFQDFAKAATMKASHPILKTTLRPMCSLVRCAILNSTPPGRMGKQKQLDIIDKQKGALEGAFELETASIFSRRNRYQRE